MKLISSESCVYGIFDKDDNVIYIGSTKNINKRYKSHLADLIKKKHPNNILQGYIDCSGLDSFKLAPLFCCSYNRLLFYEMLFIKIFNPLANKSGSNRFNIDFNKKGVNDNHLVYDAIVFDFFDVNVLADTRIVKSELFKDIVKVKKGLTPKKMKMLLDGFAKYRGLEITHNNSCGVRYCILTKPSF